MKKVLTREELNQELSNKIHKILTAPNVGNTLFDVMKALAPHEKAFRKYKPLYVFDKNMFVGYFAISRMILAYVALYDSTGPTQKENEYLINVFCKGLDKFNKMPLTERMSITIILKFFESIILAQAAKNLQKMQLNGQTTNNGPSYVKGPQ